MRFRKGNREQSDLSVRQNALQMCIHVFVVRGEVASHLCNNQVAEATFNGAGTVFSEPGCHDDKITSGGLQFNTGIVSFQLRIK